jgi:hypothetical protein
MMGPGACAMREADLMKHVQGARRPISLRQLFQAEQDIIQNAQMREQSSILKYQTDAPTVRAFGKTMASDASTKEKNLSGIHGLEPRDRPQKRTLPATGRPQETGNLARPHAEVDISDSGSALIKLRQAPDLD